MRGGAGSACAAVVYAESAFYASGDVLLLAFLSENRFYAILRIAVYACATACGANNRMALRRVAKERQRRSMSARGMSAGPVATLI